MSTLEGRQEAVKSEVSRAPQSSLAFASELSADNEVSTGVCGQAHAKNSSLAMLSMESAELYQTLDSGLGRARRVGVEESTEKFILTHPQLWLSDNLHMSRIPVTVWETPLGPSADINRDCKKSR